MMDQGLELQKSIWNALKAYGPLAAVVGTSIFDWVPEGTAFPYISIGGDTAVEFSSQTFDGIDATLVIHSWSRGEGRKEVKTIMGHIYNALHKAQLSIANTQKVVLIRLAYAETILDPDGVTYHGIQRFRSLTQGV